MARARAVIFGVIASVFATAVCGQPPPLAIPASSGVLDNSFSLTSASIQGFGSSAVQSVSLSDGAGVAVFAPFGGNNASGPVTFDVAAYQYQDWTEYGLGLYDLIGVSRDSQLLVVMYIYVSQPSGALNTLYYESFALPDADDSEMAGTVTASGTAPERVSVSFPALTAPVPPRTPYTIAAEGDSFSLNSTSGSYTDGNGVTYSVVPFASVDCTSCGGGGWYELHSLFLTPDTTGKPNAIGCFGILYFEFDAKTSVSLDYSLCLPALTRWDSQTIAVPNGWSGALGAGAHIPPFAMPRRTPRGTQRRS